MKYVYRFANWFPVATTVVPVFLFVVGAGGRAKRQSPMIHEWVSSGLFGDVYFPFAMKVMPFLCAAIYVGLFFQTVGFGLSGEPGIGVGSATGFFSQLASAKSGG